MNPIDILNMCIFRCISFGLIKSQDPLVSTFLSSVSFLERMNFSFRAALRIPFCVIVSNSIEPFKQLSGRMERAPVQLVEDCVQALLNSDKDKIQICDKLLSQVLPSRNLDERWTVILKCVYLKEVCRTIIDKQDFLRLFFACPNGFRTGLRNHLILSAVGVFRTNEEINAYIWRQAKRPSFHFAIRPIVYKALKRMTFHWHDPNYDLGAYKDIFTSQLTDYENKPFVPQQLNNSSNWLEQVLSMCRACNICDALIYHYLTGSRAGMGRKPYYNTCISLFPERLSQYGKTIATFYMDHLEAAKSWFVSRLHLGDALAYFCAIYVLNHLGFYSVEYLACENTERNIFPAFLHKPGEPLCNGRLSARAGLVIDYFSTSKENQLRLAKSNKKSNKKDKAPATEAKSGKALEKIGRQQDTWKEDIYPSQFMHSTAEKFLKNFKVPTYSF